MGYLRDKWIACLIGASIIFAPCSQAQEVSSPEVSFWTLPALRSATPIPGSNQVPGDFSGNGISDLLWFNPELSQMGYWTMSVVPAPSNVAVSDIHIFNVTQGYYVGAVGDFNNDGYADIVFTSENRDLWLWTNNKGGGFISEYMGTYPSEWQLIGAGDVNGDGYDDLLWLNPSGCQFAYWTMQGTNRIGFKIIPISCGYYPIGIGYYTPSNRISILWTSPAKDLYIWDSTPTGFKSYDLGTSYNAQYGWGFAKVWAIGGGFMGRGIGIESIFGSPDANGVDMGGAAVYSRIFDISGNQIAFVRDPNPNYDWSGALPSGWQFSGGHIVQGNGINSTGLYSFSPAKKILSVAGAGVSNIYYSNVPVVPAGTRWTYPDGWWIVGAPGNGAAVPPWQ